eukprot:TRINITY_DN15960_c0_g1::TRINITY_DN15960_c0_g1_i1::g.3774::m.3774 TRINITY_DN15960_c0_g1::TRINITY_DN15960_c0_g1_i1::g.3774  ORF type:complete len:508 (-),score=21.69,sp/Q8YTC2/Y2800_NOSS1/31.66/2e-38,sp/Q8YTC2/Y2800_NOSS1/29.04/2e-38,sp/Q8YTC2/Y2800_NOSS1/30.10/2e-33,sp/Q8YTC2/Y2800_NOSS1/24.73/1e-29,sp/Q8YTC2/Y2800_NOSS1/26.77/1e-28,sp/Q8YTC2/Y2800_NOSS1/25.54/3e-26,sp/Q8YTC2/Y2800_NOSS1/30.74/5e-26,sp/Q8YTC2/Y2800_NOSS1/26.34/5e-24,sp/Q8YTC2/Y2800_NOSS1/24.84/5e-23,sp/Q8YTC2/Y2800_NOSS1/38.46/5e-
MPASLSQACRRCVKHAHPATSNDLSPASVAPTQSQPNDSCSPRSDNPPASPYECERDPCPTHSQGSVYCLDCQKMYCVRCSSEFHAKGNRKTHVVKLSDKCEDCASRVATVTCAMCAMMYCGPCCTSAHKRMVHTVANIQRGINEISGCRAQGEDASSSSISSSTQCIQQNTRTSNFIITGSPDNTACIFIWNIHTLERVGTLNGHTDRLISAKLSPDGKFILTASLDKTARIWNSTTLECVGTLGTNISGPNNVSSAIYSPDGRFILTVLSDRTARIWNSTTMECAGILNSIHDPVKSAIYSPDGKFIMTISVGNQPCIWDSATFQRVGGLVDSTSARSIDVIAAIYSPNSKFILTTSSEKITRIWDSATLKCVGTSNMTVNSAKYSPDGKVLLTASAQIALWDSVYLNCIYSLTHDVAVFTAIFSPDGKLILFAEENMVRVWSRATMECVGNLVGHTGRVTSIMYTTDEKFIVTQALDKTVRIWNTVSLKCEGALMGHERHVLTV